MLPFLDRLKKRKLVQWALAYLAGAWVLFEVSDAVGGRLGWPDTLYHGFLVVLTFGFFITLVLAWYHGEKGRQRVSGPEVLMVAMLVAVAGIAMAFLLSPGEDGEGVTDSRIPKVVDERPGVAVLPCRDDSPDPDDAWWASSLHDEILSKLARVSSLRSMGRETVEWHRQNPLPLPEIAAALSVDFVGECSVQKDPFQNRVRLRFQMMDASGALVWADDFDKEFSIENLLDIQIEVALEVAGAMAAELTPEEEARILAAPTDDLDAYELYLLGRNRWYTRSPASLREAIAFFGQAVVEDSTFALAYAGLADAYASLPFYDLATDSREILEQAKPAAVRGLAIDSASAETHAALGWIALTYEWEFDVAERHFSKALELAPNLPGIHHQYSSVLASLGRFDEALEEAILAYELNPRSNAFAWTWADRHYLAGRVEEALHGYERAIQMDPPVIWALLHFAWSLAREEPIDTVKASQLLGQFFGFFGYSAPEHLPTIVKAIAGDPHAQEAAGAILTEIVERTILERGDLLLLYSIAVPPEEFFDALEEAVGLRHPWVPFVHMIVVTFRPEMANDPGWGEHAPGVRYPTLER